MFLFTFFLFFIYSRCIHICFKYVCSYSILLFKDKHLIFAETGELIIAKLSTAAYEELGRMKLVEPTAECFGRAVVWSHPAFANQCVYARNDREIVCVSLAK